MSLIVGIVRAAGNALWSWWWVLLLGALALRVFWALRRPAEYKSIPMAPHWKIWRSMLANEPFFARAMKLYFPRLDNQGVILIKIGPYWQLQTTNPKVAKLVLMNPERFPKLLPRQAGWIAKRIVGTNVVFSNGAEWRHHRRLVDPAFKNDILVTHFVDCWRTLNERWVTEFGHCGDLGIYDWMQRITTDVLGKVLFGHEFNSIPGKGSRLLYLFNRAMDSGAAPIYRLLPFVAHMTFIPFVRRTRKELDEMDAELADIVEQRREQHKRAQTDPNDPFHFKESDLLDHIIDDSQGERLTFQEIRASIRRDNLFVLFAAGHDTTTMGLTAVMYLLAKHRDAQQRLRSLIEEVLPLNAPYDAVPSPAEIKDRIPYLHAIIKEAQRLYPSTGTLTGRVASETTQILPQTDTRPAVHVRKGDWVVINSVMQGRSADLWEYPNEFIPERFMEEEDRAQCKVKLTRPVVPFAWIPFGTGSRLCLGYNMSLLEQSMIICLMLRNYDISLPNDSPHKHEIQFCNARFLSARSLKLTFTRRTVNEYWLAQRQGGGGKNPAETVRTGPSSDGPLQKAEPVLRHAAARQVEE